MTRWRGMESAPPQTNPDIFATSFRDLTPALYDFLYRLAGREEAADALIRQVASQAAMSAASATQWPSARAWLFARAYAALPETSAAAGADPAPFIETDPALLPPVPPESGLDDMARAVWRAISALPVEQHALLHLHIREAMVGGEAASVLGITEREATERLQRLIPAVEAASRALFLIRFGRPRDPDLDALLAQLNITRLTPEARSRIEAYAETSPAAQALLTAVPPPLTVYAALRPLPPPPAIIEEAVAGALPWLAVAAEPVAPPPGAAMTAIIPEEPPYSHTYETTTLTPQAEGWQYGQGAPSGAPPGTPYGAPTEQIAEGYGGYGAADPPETPPEQWNGTQMLDIPVRQRVVREEAVYTPPRTANRGMGPLALLGVLGGALVLVVGALVIFLVKGGSGPSGASVTATVGGTATVASSPTSAISPALLTATAIANTIGSPTPIPTLTSPPLPPNAGTTIVATAIAGTTTATSGSVVVPTAGSPSSPTPLVTFPSGSALATLISTETFTIVPPTARITQIPVETPTPRVTPVPTNTTAPTKATTPAPTPTTAPPTATTGATAKATTPAATPATAASGGTIAVDKESVTLPAGGSSASVTLSNGGTGTTTFTAKANVPWLSVSPASGSIPAKGTLPATLSVNRASLTRGTSYSGSITFTSADGHTTTVTVTFTA